MIEDLKSLITSKLSDNRRSTPASHLKGDNNDDTFDISRMKDDELLEAMSRLNNLRLDAEMVEVDENNIADSLEPILEERFTLEKSPTSEANRSRNYSKIKQDYEDLSKDWYGDLKGFKRKDKGSEININENLPVPEKEPVNPSSNQSTQRDKKSSKTEGI